MQSHTLIVSHRLTQNFLLKSSFLHGTSRYTHHCDVCTDLLALASCLIYARALLEYVIFIMWVRSLIKMLASVKFVEHKVLTFLILCEKC